MYIIRKRIYRYLAASLFVLFLLCPTLSFAFGVGGLQLDSTLNQKLDASIALIGVQDDELSSIVINLAPNAIYERMGIEQNSTLAKLNFSLDKTSDGDSYIRVSTNEIITEPFINFLIELNWPSGRLLREFTLLLDPPVLLDEKPSPIESPKTDIPPSFTVTTNGNVEKSEVTLATKKIVNKKPSQQGSNQVDTDADSEINKVLADILAAANSSGVATEEVLSEESAEELESILVEESEVESVVNIQTNTGSNSLVYEKVRSDEILWHIAEKMRPENISVEQMMLALQRENSQAFYGDNVSFLKAGAVLRIDDTATLNQVSVDEAIEEISRQHQSWLDYRSERLARNAVAAESVSSPKFKDLIQDPIAEVAAVKPKREFLSQPRLKLVSPIEEQNDDAVSQTNAVLEVATEKLSQLHIELAIASEAVEAGKHENDELLNRLSALEEQMSAMQSLIQLKDSELARLQGVDVAQEFEFLPPIVLNTGLEAAPLSSAIGDFSESPKKQEHSLLSDPITIATGIFAVIMLSLLAWFVRGRKTKTVESEELVASDAQQKSLDELFPEDTKEEAETSVIKFNESVAEEFKSEISTDALAEISFEHAEMLDSSEVLLDPIAEADVYLTYEKYEKAESLLQEAIESDSDRQELKLKLLEVYALSRNIVKFDHQAEKLFAAIGGSEDSSLWQHAQLMAEDIDTKSSLFNDDAIKANIEVEANEISTIEKALGAVKWSPEQVTEFKASEESLPTDEVEVEVDVKAGIEAKTEIDATAEIDAKAEVDVKAAEFSSATKDEKLEPIQHDKLSEDIKVIENVISGSTPEISDEDLEQAMASFTETAVEQDRDITTGEEVNEIVSEAIDNAVSFSAHPTEEENTSSVTDSTMFLLSDEVGTKLDLAKAYIEMGDQEGAHDLLGEVLNEGSTQQKNEARELMAMSE